MTGVLWAVAAGLVYAAISLRFPDRFPFATYSMYAKLRDRVEGAVFYVSVEGALVPIGQLDRFVGVSADRLDPQGFPCSQEWVVWEARRWVEGNVATEPAAGAVPVEFGFRLLRLQNFQLTERRVPLTSGWAHWRRR